MKNYSKIIEDQIISLANKSKAQWLENYVKHDIKSYGVGIPQIREVVKSQVKNHSLNLIPLAEQIKMLNEMMSKEYTENKITAILFIQLYGQEIAVKEQLHMYSMWFDNKWIFDWNVCDWLCVRLIAPLLDKDPQESIAELQEWNRAEYFWKARASLVSFAVCKTIKNHKKIISDFSKLLIKRKERFSKTSVGWALREFSKHDKLFVKQFLKNHESWTTPEVIKNATKYI